MGVSGSGMSCVINTAYSGTDHTSSAPPILTPPLRMSLTPLGTAELAVKNMRYFLKQYSIEEYYSPFSYYYKLAHKRLHSFSSVSMTDVVTDMEFLFSREQSGFSFFHLVSFASPAYIYN